MTNTVTIIAQEVSRVTGVSIPDILSERRDLHIVNARHLAMVLTREFTPFGSAKIARAWHRADHTTVLHAYRQWPKRASVRGLGPLETQAREAVRERLNLRRLAKVEVTVCDVAEAA